LQENYDNTGLITGDGRWECSGIICCLDSTEEVINEAINKNCNLVIAHHPIIFRGLKKINGKNYVEKSVIAAIKNDIAIYAIHTNLDNVIDGVSGKMAEMIGLKNITVLDSKVGTLKKLYVFVPTEKSVEVRNAIFEAGAGHIGDYSECSFNTDGIGTYKAGQGSHPYKGSIGLQHQEKEHKIEIIFPGFLENKIVTAMKAAHPYEEVAYDVLSLSNEHPKIGSGVYGELEEALNESDFLGLIKSVFRVSLLRHSKFRNTPIKKVALCGGAGSFLISTALLSGVDAFLTADLKYHDFFDANGKILIADIGHYESEQFTIDMLQEILELKFPTFAVLKTKVMTNPVHYF
ncbi:MAG: Nif3-like dinuclear metal center hexameric protein, partial [Chitinophagaceae bacterium]